MPRKPTPRPSGRTGWLLVLVAALGGLIAHFLSAPPAHSPAPLATESNTPGAPPAEPQPREPGPSPGASPTLPLPDAPPENGAQPSSTPLPGEPAASAPPRPADLKVADAFDPRIVRRVKPAEEARLVALTFDDGPWPGSTPAVLDILAREGVKATFFWIGQHLERYPDLAQRVVAEGHALGNHTYSHRSAASPTEVAAEEIGRTNALIEELTGVRTRLFRPPGGHLENGLVKHALEQGYVAVMWSALADDTKPGIDAASIVHNVMGRVRPGSIVLLHDGGGDRTRTLEALPLLIERLRAEGYRFVTVPELLESGEVDTNPWAARP